MRPRQPKLSETDTGQAWLGQFNEADQPAAAALLDAMLLLNTEQVSQAIRTQLRDLGGSRWGRKRRLALYAERKLGGKAIFTEKLSPDRQGRLRRRAYGRNVSSIAPIRGGTRVGSEGIIANLISQVVQAEGGAVFANHPGPDRIRGKTGPTQTIVIVTDLIGSGRRILGWLDALWASRSVRSWVSLKLLDFAVVAAVSTRAGEEAIRRHRLKPVVRAMYMAPVVPARSKDPDEESWRRIIRTEGPSAGRGAGRGGYGADPCLVAFSYRIPNNTPALIHQTDPAVPWRALYEGGIPSDLDEAFGIRDLQAVMDAAAESAGVPLSLGLSPKQQLTVLVLSLIKGRLRPGQAEAIAQETQLPLPDVQGVLAEAATKGLLDPKGRLTGVGQKTVLAGRSGDRRRPVVPTSAEPYYPGTLRVPRAPV